MTPLGISLPLSTAAAFVIAFAVFMYVVMDGFDLGIGILFPSFSAGDERNQAMNSIAPLWDGNETWLVLGGGGLMAMFPLAYAVILTATYPLIITMLLGLVFRGVAFEFRWRDPRHRRGWDFAFSFGSLAAAFAQGMILGSILQGIRVGALGYGGQWFDWLTPFTLLTGAGVVAGYALLGATWLVWKIEGTAERHARRLAQYAAAATLAFIALVSAATPFLQNAYWKRWFGMPGVLLTAQVPLLTIIVAVLLFRKLRGGGVAAPFVLALLLFALGFAGLGISLFPYIVPNSITIADAAAPPQSLVFVLAGIGTILPLILTYTAWAYWVFRGKVGTDGYH